MARALVLVALAFFSISNTFADGITKTTHCFKAGDTVFTTDGIPTRVIEAHCEEHDAWYLTERPHSIEGQKKISHGHLSPSSGGITSPPQQ